MKLVTIALAALMAVPAYAKDYRASNRMIVTPVSANSFKISGIPDNTPQSHWCAAGEYAHRFLNARFEQRMYVVGDAVRGQREYLISLDPAGTKSATTRSKEFSIRLDGANRRVDEGLDFCRNRFLVRGLFSR